MRRVLFAVLVMACGDTPEGFTEADLSLIRLMVLPAEAAPDPTNRLANNLAAAQLGQALFFDTTLSNPPGVSCADCHTATSWFIDTVSKPNNVSAGCQPAAPTDGGVRPPVPFTKRNSASLVNVAHYRWWAWDGRSDSLWMQCAVAYESGRTMSGTRDRIARAMAERYGPLMKEAGIEDRSGFDPNGAASYAYKALAAYLTRLNSGAAPFDRFAEGDQSALSPAAKKGLKLFIGKAGCIECHNGPAFNGAASAKSEDDFYRSVGIAQRGDNVEAADLGRWDGVGALTNAMTGQALYSSAGPYNDFGTGGFNRVAGITAREEDKGMFRIKSLRQVAETAPYMHAGQLPTLASVVEFYNSGGDASGYAGVRDRSLTQSLGLTADEQLELVAFLGSLTGAPLPRSLTCDSSLTPRKGASLCDGGVAP